ncbi:adenylate kinase [Rathayibacter rathayi]|uniref:Adenylate kinase n=1 Tax=Rathayibacter rathayi TaxID=33887 RepID=A0ABD6WBU3_RATRA|nr:adenylate kinase [Rathayibacter rathayi]AZZ48708.1 adenylate kinase [Rathayibacter rathayi]MWV73785.1 adenylate kinase [Rathayibacter rathayi NCPPB 2980 = VKM Ac-1601]PPF15761.1 adenylate kinase [Rathayibacter rathayi]PPF25316.1 adenylate kinase [Rathayibacter rathayi]PPF50848.1 adenylate kinase [Rathayibacter rathayi]
MRVIMMGPPGVGKGTQAVALSRTLAVPAISTGELFRAQVAGGTELGRRLKALVEAGEYVPDQLTNALVAERIDEDDARDGFILDGYPRTLTQVDALTELLEERGTPLWCVVLLTADVDVVLARLHARAQEQGRADDDPEVVRNRIEVYERETAPLATVYEERGLLVRIDGSAAQHEVAESILAACRLM